VLQPIRRVLALLLLAVMCGYGCKPSASAGDKPQPPAVVRLGYFANVTHAQAVLGVESGAFASAVAPAKFESRIFNAGPSLIEALFAGQIDVGYIGPGPALNGFDKSQGDGLRVISGGAANGVLIVARPGSGIRTLADLKSRNLATPQYGNTQDLAARAYLRTVLGQSSLDDVKPVPNAEQLGQLSRGQIDAAWAPEPWGSYLMLEGGATLVAREEDLWSQGNFATTVVISTPEFLAKHPDVVERLLKVHVDLTESLASESSRQLPALKVALFKLTNKQLPTGVLESAIRNVSFTTDPLPHTFDRMADWSYDLKFSRQRTDLKALFDLRALQKLQALPASAPASKRRLDD
jgi:NitT/TauT family transport system substrate-binding protein